MPDDNPGEAKVRELMASLPDVLEAVALTAEEWRRRHRMSTFTFCASCSQRGKRMLYGCAEELLTPKS